MYCVEFGENIHSGDMAIFVCHHDWRLSSFLTKDTPMLLDTTRNGTVNELQARSDGCLNLERLALTPGFLIAFLLSHNEDVSMRDLFG
jgi:hypothetical protein